MIDWPNIITNWKFSNDFKTVIIYMVNDWYILCWWQDVIPLNIFIRCNNLINFYKYSVKLSMPKLQRISWNSAELYLHLLSIWNPNFGCMLFCQLIIDYNKIFHRLIVSSESRYRTTIDVQKIECFAFVLDLDLGFHERKKFVWFFCNISGSYSKTRFFNCF